MGPSNTKWLGDLRTCFLLDEGWAFRFKLNRFQLAGRAGWRLPLSFAEAINLHEGEHRFFAPADPQFGEEVAISCVDRKCSGGPIDMPLRALGAREGDLAFFSVSARRYAIRIRREDELDDEDPLGRLMWSCGLDPRDDSIRFDPWPELCKALGRPVGGYDAVRRALTDRKDEAMLSLFEAVGSGARVRDIGEPWPAGWASTMPLGTETDQFALVSTDQSVRTAVGVADTSGQLPRPLIRGEAGVLWLHGHVPLALDELTEGMEGVAQGYVPCARRKGWARWMRAEHAARRAALLGLDWEISASTAGWSVLGETFEGLDAALEAVGAPFKGAPKPPISPARATAPTSSMAFKQLSKNALRNGLDAVSGSTTVGFVARFGNSESVGPTLADVLR